MQSSSSSVHVWLWLCRVVVQMPGSLHLCQVNELEQSSLLCFLCFHHVAACGRPHGEGRDKEEEVEVGGIATGERDKSMPPDAGC